jgi:hypothetical protein
LHTIWSQCNKTKTTVKAHKICKQLEVEQYIAQQSVGYRRNKGGCQKVPKIKWKWKHNLSEPMGTQQRQS